MERETKTIKTPVEEHEVILKTWLTGREKRALRGVFFAKVKMTTETEETIKDVNPAQLMEEVESKSIEIVVESVDGTKEKILDRILDMNGKDYDFVMGEITKVTQEADFLKSWQMPNVGTGSGK